MDQRLLSPDGKYWWDGQKWNRINGGQPPWWRRQRVLLAALGLVLIVLLAYAVLAVWVLPDRIVSMDGGKPGTDTRLKAITDTRGALLGLLAPVVVGIGAVAAFLTYWETSAQNRRTLELSRQTLQETSDRDRQTLELSRRTLEETSDRDRQTLELSRQMLRAELSAHRPARLSAA